MYEIEENEILRKAYQLLAYFFANKVIARAVHPQKSDDPLKTLETLFFRRETSALLLQVAILFRTLDDQFMRSTDSAQRDRYSAKVAQTNERYGFDMFDKLPIRECCNKIIHTTTFEPISVEGSDPHTKDYAAFYEGHEREMEWHHFDGHIRISGSHGNKDWAYLINVPEFIEALSYLLQGS